MVGEPGRRAYFSNLIDFPWCDAMIMRFIVAVALNAPGSECSRRLCLCRGRCDWLILPLCNAILHIRTRSTPTVWRRFAFAAEPYEVRPSGSCIPSGVIEFAVSDACASGVLVPRWEVPPGPHKVASGRGRRSRHSPIAACGVLIVFV